MSRRKAKSHAKNVISTHKWECHVPASFAPATKFMAKVPTAECVLCTIKLKTAKDRRSLHNEANGEVLRYLVEMVHDTLGTDAAKVIFPPACRVIALT